MENGGMQSYLITLMRSIDRDRYKFDFLVYNDNPLYYNEIRELGGNIYICPSGKNVFDKLLKRYKYKCKLYKKEHFDIVHVHVGTPSLPYLGIIEKIYKIPSRIFHCHCSERKMTKLMSYLTSISRCIMSKTYNKFIAVSEKAAEWGFDKKIVKNKEYIYVPDGIIAKKFLFDEQARKKVRRELNIENKVVIGNIGRFTEQKNQEFLLEVIHELNKKGLNCCLLLVGEGNLEKKLKEKASELGISGNVIFYGTTKEISSVLSAMDVFAFPSLFEGLGIAAVEAQANGLTVIASENVPYEAKVTKNFEIASIYNGVEPWVRRICEAIKKGRVLNNEEILSSIKSYGYDISSTVKILSNLYSQMVCRK